MTREKPFKLFLIYRRGLLSVLSILPKQKQRQKAITVWGTI